MVDKLGYIPFSKSGSELLFHFFLLRYERGSFLITTNLKFERWIDVFGDPQLIMTLLDRLTNKAIILTLNGESYRFRETMKLWDTEQST